MTPHEITTASQLDIAVRNALVDYIQTSRVTDWATLKDYAQARYYVMLHNTAIIDLVQQAGVLLVAPSHPPKPESEPELAAAIQPKARVRRIS